VLIGLVVASAITMSKTLGVPPPPPYKPLPPTGGFPTESLALTGKLAHDNGVYKLQIDALPGYVVTLRFATSDLKTSASTLVGQQVTVTGHWDSANPTVFVVESAVVSGR
jgi:hypothetical protein